MLERCFGEVSREVGDRGVIPKQCWRHAPAKPVLELAKERHRPQRVETERGERLPHIDVVRGERQIAGELLHEKVLDLFL